MDLLWLQAAGWGLLAGGALLIGAAVGYFVPVSSRVIAWVMAFGSGVLISALCFELVGEAYRQGGFYATALGFFAGALVYTGANLCLARYGARHRKRSADGLQPSEQSVSGSGTAIAIGALLDGVPESIVIGLSMLQGGVVSLVTVAAIFLSNLPEGLSSAAGMRRAGRGKTYVFGVWGGIAVISGAAALAGFTLFEQASAEVLAATTAVAAGAILAMLADTMIPEAFADAHDLAGLITATGFLTAFILGNL
ncbi:ZIP family metal transporter [Alloalcanivorax mobilis]|uniref:ZIP family metal transporter n=1 Tax=Alloalcanivorax mobilis TaxID=2019569 RepID=UPI000C785810|nr:ZIP family zinc transporter [Alloalcanivorax mobilis]